MNLLSEIKKHRFVAILRGRDPEAARAVVRRLIDLEVRLVEVSLTSADAPSVLRAAVAHAEGAETLVGVGTIRTAADAQQAVDLGAAFAVTPTSGSGFAECVRLGLPVLAGAFTPTEIDFAWESGAAAVKLFPASAVSPGYLRALRDPFPNVPLVPVGGVDAASAREFLDSGAVGVGVGAPLLGDAPHGGRLDQVDGAVASFRELLS